MKVIGRTALILLAWIILLSACTKTTSGLQGKVVLANCTGQQIATDCTPQSIYVATIEIYNDKVVKIKTVRTEGDGTFTIYLKPGLYYVHPVPEVQGKFPMAADFKVIVPPGKLIPLTIDYDMGVRVVPTGSP